MSDLYQKNCIPCRGGVPPFDISEIHKYLKKVDGWSVKKNKEMAIYKDATREESLEGIIYEMAAKIDELKLTINILYDDAEK